MPKFTLPSTTQPPLRVAINGFGRIGRNVLRAYLERLLEGDRLANGLPSVADIQIVAINDLADASTLLHLLKYDSTHGRLDARIGATLTDNTLCIDLPTHRISLTILREADPKYLPWRDLNIDVVLESTGHFRSYEGAYQHLVAGARQVIIGAAPFDHVDASIVLGVNRHALTRKQPIVSGVSCTTQALVPLLFVLDNAFGVQSAMMTEIHAVTADQTVLDQAHRDWRRARASGYNMIPTTSSSIAAVGKVLPAMADKINGHSIRVPTIDVAAIDVTLTLNTAVTSAELNACLQHASANAFWGIMAYSDEPLVSSDYIHHSASLVIDSLQTMQVGTGTCAQYKVFAWYDNEWGYANRMLDMLAHLAALAS